MKKTLIIILITLALTACQKTLPLVLKAPEQNEKVTKLVPVHVRETKPIVVSTPPVIFINQLGYVPNFEKTAIYKTSSANPIEWQIIDGKSLQVLQKGRTTPIGYDQAADEKVHIINFSDFNTIGSQYRLKIAGNYSHPFSISKNIYSSLKIDALNFFYHQRSGIDIKMPYAKDDSRTRKAGHMSDAKIDCAPKDFYTFESGEISKKYACTDTLNLSGGWYDAGDHGKYIVNGGSAVWTLLNQYERLQYKGADKQSFDDGTLSIPENKNSVPDILDEARWEIEFLLKMQVNGGKTSGMLRHKLHDDSWTGLGLSPADDTGKRHVYPVSTTATLNGAAVFAQAARIYKKHDEKFADICLAAATRAYKAAKKNPSVLASKDGGHGGGPYDDPRTDDEMYWAAAELYITTSDKQYLDYIKKSDFFQKIPSFLEHDNTDGVFTWKDVAPLGSISLALVPNELDEELVKEIRQNIVIAANDFDQKMGTTGYRVPLTTEPKGTYPWGSNSNIINNLMIISLAYDFTKDKTYIDALLTGMDYLLGKNPMDTCYVTGYGANPVKNPHHRFFANQINSKFPTPPPGIFSGGPNSGIQDDYAKKHLTGCAPAKCYIDHADSWSTNEIAINWNASFAWVTAFIDDTIK